MSEASAAQAATSAGDKLIEELSGGSFARAPSAAPSMGRLTKVHYTHEAMIEFILSNGGLPPGTRLTQGMIAAHFGYTEAWISNILASDAFQEKLKARRSEVVDPEISATMEERFRALAIQSLKVLQHKLNQPVVSDNVALRAAELGAKALGIGGHAAPKAPDTGADRLERLAKRLIDLNAGSKGATVDGKVESVQLDPLPQGG